MEGITCFVMVLLTFSSFVVSTPAKGCKITSVNGEIDCQRISRDPVRRNYNISCLHGQRDNIRCICDYGWTGTMCDQIECLYGNRINDTKCVCNFGVVGTLCDECADSTRFRPPHCTIIRKWPLEIIKVKHLEDALVKSCVHIYHLPCGIVLILVVVCFCWCRYLKPNKRLGARCKFGTSRAYLALSQVCESTPPSSFRRITVPLPSYEEICAREKQQCDQKAQPISDHLGMRPTSLASDCIQRTKFAKERSECANNQKRNRVMEKVQEKQSISECRRKGNTTTELDEANAEREAKYVGDEKRQEEEGDRTKVDGKNGDHGYVRSKVEVTLKGMSDGEDQGKEEKDAGRIIDLLLEHERMELKKDFENIRVERRKLCGADLLTSESDLKKRGMKEGIVVIRRIDFSDCRSALYDYRSACYMNMLLWEKAIDDCTEFLQIGGPNRRIQKRRAECYVNLTRSYIEMFEDYKRKARNVPEETYTKELHRIRNISEKEENYIEMRNLKDDVISEELRKAGNQYYFRGEFEMALRMYFEALDTAPQVDLTYYLSMKNISTVLMKLGFYKEALKHLRRLLNAAEEFSSDMLNKTLFRERIRECEGASERKLYIPPKQELYKEPSSACTQLSSAVCFKYDENRERHLVAAENIPEGAVVIREVPIIMVALNSVTTCKYCTRLLPLSYLPCRDCDARFCDEGCREKGALIHALDHRYGYGSGLKKAGMCEMVAKALYEFPDEEMKACLAKMPDRKDVSRRIDGTSFASIMLLKDYPFDDDNDIVDQFIDNFCQVMDGKFTDMALSKRREFVASVTKEVLKRIPLNANCVHRNPQEITLDSQMASFLVESSTVPFARETYRSRITQLLARCPKDMRQTLIGMALLPVASTANHSCVPNMYHSYSDTDGRCFVMRAIKDIRAGQELLWSYGPLAGCHTYEQRKERCSTLNSLMQKYGFVCKCEVCRHCGDHEIDKKIISRICYYCHRLFVAPQCNELLCESCRIQFGDTSELYEQLGYLFDVEKMLDAVRWQSCDQDKLAMSFEHACGMYPYGNQRLSDFTIMAFFTAFRDGEMDNAYTYLNRIIDMRMSTFGDQLNCSLAYAHYAFAIFLYIRILTMVNCRKKKQLENMKKHIYEARQLFRIFYGKGSVRDFELDFMLNEARRVIAQ
uniref:SET domain-containing protein n=1 Tax=Ascaris lumbricoides TaxID=6252 RepID=A0A0M3HMW6_ASCLU